MCYSTALRKQKEAIEKKLRHKLDATCAVEGASEPYYHLNGFTNIGKTCYLGFQ